MKAHARKVKSLILLLFLSLFISSNLQAQDQKEGLGLPGDNLNLFAVLDIFQKSKTLEDFERALNSESNKINNLDLNNDGRTDYIKVIDNPRDNTHAIVMQVDLNVNESQDIAVIYVDKDRNGNTDIQIVGDEDLYGEDYVVEPQSETPNPGYSGNRNNNNDYNQNYTPMSEWVIINYMYSPFYSNYISPWYWGYYPGWWNPWNPFYWNDYYYHCYHRYNWYWGWNFYHFHHFNRFRSQHAGWYRKEHRRTSSTYHRYRKEGVYTKSYQGNPPSVRPTPASVNKEGKPVVNRATTPLPDRKGDPVINRQNQGNEHKTEPVINRPAERPREQINQPVNRPQQVERPAPQPAPRPVERSVPTPSPRPVERSTPAPTPRQESRPASPPVQRSAPAQSRPAQQPQSAPRRR